jgi:predicted MFS family arabinose efflux permease
MFCFFLGGIAGSPLSARAYARSGRTGVSVTGAAFGLAAFTLWLTGRRDHSRRPAD